MKKVMFIVVVLSCFLIVGCDVQQIQQDVNAVAVPVQQALADANTQDINGLLNTIQAVNLATMPVNPYAPVIALGVEVAKVGLPLIVGLLGVLFGRKQKKALVEVVNGGQEFKLVADPKAVEQFKTAQAIAQSTSTKKIVAEIKS